MWYVSSVFITLLHLSAYSQTPYLKLTSGTEVDVPTITPGTSVSFPVNLENTSSEKTLVNIQPSFASDRYQFLGGSFPGIGGSCSTSLGPSQSCSLMLENLAANTGDYDDEMQFNYTMLFFGGSFPPPTEQANIRIDGYSYPTTCTMTPEITSVLNQIIVASTTEQVRIFGNHFASNSAISVPGLSVTNSNFSNPGEMSFDLTAGGSTGQYDIIINNDCGSFTLANSLTVQASAWIDLRTAGGVSQAAPEFTNGPIAGYAVDPSFGLRLNVTSTTWQKSVRFSGLCDSVNQDFDIVVYRTGTSDRVLMSLFNENIQIDPYPNTTASYQRAYIGAWNFGGGVSTVYGTEADNGGSGWSQAIGNKAIQTGQYYRYHFENAGQSGGRIEVWRVDANFNDIAQVGGTTISNKPSTPAVTVCPGLSPFDTGNVDYYITGLRIQ